MRLANLIFLGATVLTLSGCVTTKEAADKIAEVQSTAKTICGFVPTAATVVALFNTDAGQTVAGWGAVICNAVTNNPQADGPGPANYKPVVNGVRIKGKFVR